MIDQIPMLYSRSCMKFCCIRLFYLHLSIFARGEIVLYRSIRNRVNRVRKSLKKQFLQGVSVAASPVIAMIGKPSVCLSVCHTLALCENEAD